MGFYPGVLLPIVAAGTLYLVGLVADGKVSSLIAQGVADEMLQAGGVPDLTGWATLSSILCALYLFVPLAANLATLRILTSIYGAVLPGPLMERLPWMLMAPAATSLLCLGLLPSGLEVYPQLKGLTVVTAFPFLVALNFVSGIYVGAQADGILEMRIETPSARRAVGVGFALVYLLVVAAAEHFCTG